MKPPPPLNYIRSFECSARHLSFTAAASELGYTQAAVSNHVRALEHYIGRQLFVRYPRSLKLTEVGEAFLPTSPFPFAASTTARPMLFRCGATSWRFYARRGCSKDPASLRNRPIS